MSGCKINAVLAILSVCAIGGCGLPASLDEWREYRAVEALIARGADLNAEDKDIDGDLRLYRAASDGHAAVVQLLIENQANVDARDRYGYTALHYAAMSGESRVAELLLDAGAYGDSNIGADVNAKTNGGVTPLHYAAMVGGMIWVSESQRSLSQETESLKMLLKNGADPNAKTVETEYNLPETALDWAKKEYRTEAVKLLAPVTKPDIWIPPKSTKMYKMHKSP